MYLSFLLYSFIAWWGICCYLGIFSKRAYAESALLLFSIIFIGSYSWVSVSIAFVVGTIVFWCLSFNSSKLLSISLVFVVVLFLFKFLLFFESFIFPVGLSYVILQTLLFANDRNSWSQNESKYEEASMRTETLNLYCTFANVPHLIRFQNVMLFFAFFPQYLAGPLIRRSDLTIECSRSGLIERAPKATRLLAFGLAMKFLFSPLLSSVPDSGIEAEALGQWDFFGAWFFLIFNGFHVFYDLLSYWLIAAGLAYYFGVKLPENFKEPFAATSLRSYWSKWHITVSNFFFAFVYIPTYKYLSRFSFFANGTAICDFVCLFVTFFITAIWHGSSSLFLLWGCFHAMAIALQVHSRGVLQGWLPTQLAVFCSLALFTFAIGDRAFPYGLFGALVGLEGFHVPSFLRASEFFGSSTDLISFGNVLGGVGLYNMVSGILGVAGCELCRGMLAKSSSYTMYVCGIFFGLSFMLGLDDGFLYFEF